MAAFERMEPRLKPDPEPCSCGCGKIGQLRLKTWRGETVPHIRACVCRRCMGKRSRQGGLRRQSTVRDAMNIVGGSDEEKWASVFQNEVKSGKQVGPAWTWWVKAEQQALASQADHGSLHKPARIFLEPEGVNDGIVMVRRSTWREYISPALNEFYGEG